jgi:hypothetical protein
MWAWKWQQSLNENNAMGLSTDSAILWYLDATCGPAGDGKVWMKTLAWVYLGSPVWLLSRISRKLVRLPITFSKNWWRTMRSLNGENRWVQLITRSKYLYGHVWNWWSICWKFDFKIESKSTKWHASWGMPSGFYLCKSPNLLGAQAKFKYCELSSNGMCM